MKITPKDTRLVKTLKHKSPLIGCRFDPTGEHLFVSAQDNTIQRWNLATGKATPFVGHESWLRGMTFDATRGVMYSADYAGQILTWETASPKPTVKSRIDAHKGWVRALAMRPDTTELASCGNDGLVRCWSVPDGKLLRTLEGHDCHVYNLAYHPSSPHLVSADHKGKFHVWNLDTAKSEKTLDASSVLYKYDKTFKAFIGGIRSMTFSPDGKSLLGAGITNVTNAFAGVGNPLLVHYDWATGKRTLHKPKKSFRGAMWGVVWHPQDIIIAAAGGSGGSMWFWKPTEEPDHHAVKLPTNARDMDLHPDGQRLAVALSNGSVVVYDISAKPTPPKKPPKK